MRQRTPLQTSFRLLMNTCRNIEIVNSPWESPERASAVSVILSFPELHQHRSQIHQQNRRCRRTLATAAEPPQEMRGKDDRQATTPCRPSHSPISPIHDKAGGGLLKQRTINFCHSGRGDESKAAGLVASSTTKTDTYSSCVAKASFGNNLPDWHRPAAYGFA
ncbi:hypothetical protein CA85_52410 [Allorhodopirellula solitaria]|uniref:Uncharacterized protein n=1 Tax=Allorhodopirellula solitaria TaxID=2527987 RepID=A0A5C5WLJ1_9BACT|nr:hypothetical protein CA85_52410 [Allorhodopirellula solitaria]